MLLSDAAAPAPRNPASAPELTGVSNPAAASPPAATPAVRRGALVIGNGAYTHVRALPNPSNDARSIAKSLRDIGFAVSEGIDLNRAAMQTTIREFLREAATAQVAVVYYAGHGVQVDGRNYLVPVDVQFQAGNRMTDAMLEMDTIMAGLDDQVRTNILILDACRNNPMAQKVASAGATAASKAARPCRTDQP
jgi:uncharacterized caspase-like protein